MEHADLENRFTYHAPPGEIEIRAYRDIRNTAKDFAYDINKICSECREKSLAITKLEEVVMWANAAIARHGMMKTPSDDEVPF